MSEVDHDNSEEGQLCLYLDDICCPPYVPRLTMTEIKNVFQLQWCHPKDKYLNVLTKYLAGSPEVRNEQTLIYEAGSI